MILYYIIMKHITIIIIIIIIVIAIAILITNGII